MTKLWKAIAIQKDGRVQPWVSDTSLPGLLNRLENAFIYHPYDKINTILIQQEEV